MAASRSMFVGCLKVREIVALLGVPIREALEDDNKNTYKKQGLFLPASLNVRSD
jgi:hypothetical protein